MLRKLAIFLFSMLMTMSVQSKEPLEFVSGSTAPTVTKTKDGVIDRLAAEIFKRVGIDHTIEPMPAARALDLANRGIKDGDINRIKGIDKEYTNLIRVPESIMTFDFLAISKNPDIIVRDWNDLNRYKSAYMRGWKVFERNIPVTADAVIAENPEQLLGLLQHDRVELALYSHWSGIWWLAKTNMEAYFIQPPLASVDLYIYVHKRHQKLVPQLDAALKSMKADSSYQSIIDASMKQLSR